MWFTIRTRNVPTTNWSSSAERPIRNVDQRLVPSFESAEDFYRTVCSEIEEKIGFVDNFEASRTPTTRFVFSEVAFWVIIEVQQDFYR